MFDFRKAQEMIHKEYIVPLIKLNQRLIVKYEAIDKIKEQPFYR